jgi:nicotinamide-nucleotide amidase
MHHPAHLPTEATLLAETLRQRRLHIVLAESCTAGLVSATLGAIPGISAYLCGSAVTYREATKTAWLGLSPTQIAESTAVSEPVTRQMALAVLQMTPEADWSAAVTGHLGPQAPPDANGTVFIAVARRDANGPQVISVAERKLVAPDRLTRQQEAATLVLAALRTEISATL